MKIRAIKTEVIKPNDSLLSFIDKYITKLDEESIVVLASKAIALFNGDVVKISKALNKDELIAEQADLVFGGEKPYGKTLTIKDSVLIPDAGIDESNGNGNYILWPRDPMRSASEIRNYLRGKHGVKNLGVIIVDSKTTPLRWGTTGVGIGFAGFYPLRDYLSEGVVDIFGRKLEATKSNHLDGVAAAAVVVMGEADELTPLAIVTGVDFIEFTSIDNKQLEKELNIDIKEDLYEPLFRGNWSK